MATQRLGIIMHGVTGRMGMNQHLIRSILAIRDQGGVALANGDRVMPDPILIGRNAEKIEALAQAHGIARWSTDLDAALAEQGRQGVLRRRHDAAAADAAGAGDRRRQARLLREAGRHQPRRGGGALPAAKAAGIKHGVVQDKLCLPGLLQARRCCVDAGFFGRILSVRGEFGYWVFEGDLQPAQRPSWNYRREDGGGIILDMLCHWRYVLDNLFGEVKAVSCLGATHIPSAGTKRARNTRPTADDAAYATFELAGERRARDRADQHLLDDARAARRPGHLPGRRHARLGGGRAARLPHAVRVNTPQAGLEPGRPAADRFLRALAERCPTTTVYDNGFKVQWEMFLRHVVEDAPFRWDLLEGAKGVQLAECALRSWNERRWVDVPALAA